MLILLWICFWILITKKNKMTRRMCVSNWFQDFACNSKMKRKKKMLQGSKLYILSDIENQKLFSECLKSGKLFFFFRNCFYILCCFWSRIERWRCETENCNEMRKDLSIATNTSLIRNVSNSFIIFYILHTKYESKSTKSDAK